MANHNAKGWRRIVKAFGYSMKGFKACWELEEAFRQEVIVLVPLIPIGILLGSTPSERAMLVGSLLMVPIVELLNSAIEANVDRVGLERHELSKGMEVQPHEPERAGLTASNATHQYAWLKSAEKPFWSAIRG
ncbi:MAG: diacylglycerol kinase [Thiohalocapsa sp. PB-PSB1]|jgi:diacylglycerol kinase (ATP)|nr:MAG: diacylglycerol kinase [Thiohalocapsa sp. PB-PSB1]HCS90331.1 hypothetical protein [Chromatiaceae bacterium]